MSISSDTKYLLTRAVHASTYLNHICDMVKVQRLSHGMRVKPQAYGGRTIPGLIIYNKFDK